MSFRILIHQICQRTKRFIALQATANEKINAILSSHGQNTSHNSNYHSERLTKNSCKNNQGYNIVIALT